MGLCTNLIVKHCINEIKPINRLSLPLPVICDLQSFQKNKDDLRELDNAILSLIQKFKEIKLFAARFYESRTSLEQDELSQEVSMREHIQEIGTDFERTTDIIKQIEIQVMKHGERYFFDKHYLKWDTMELQKVKKSFDAITEGLD